MSFTESTAPSVLLARIHELESQLNIQTRQKIDAMSAEVIDSNPYSRLMALKRMGIVDNYDVFFYFAANECKFDFVVVCNLIIIFIIFVFYS